VSWIKTTVVGIEPCIRRMRLYSRKLSDYSPVWEEMSYAIAEAEESWFATEGGGSWAPLSQKYAEWKEKVNPGQPLLVFSNNLIESLTDPGEVVQGESPETAIVGTDVWYAELHQTGTEKMPARPPLISDSEIRVICTNILRSYLKYRV
jgi:phage gpG-like protein